MKKHGTDNTVSDTVHHRKLSKKLIAIISSSAAVLIALIITLSIVLTGGGKENYFTAPESKLPVKDKYALTRYTYDEVSSVQATLRADVLDVVKRDLPRTEPEILGDDFSLVYDENKNELRAEYDRILSANKIKASTVTFTEYPSPSHALAEGNFADQATAAGVSQADYLAYYKYMLMTQGQHLAHESARRSAASYRAFGDETPRGSESLSGWLTKHPSADAQYGKVEVKNNAVEKIIKLDTLYRGQHTSGLYLPAGEVVTVKVNGLKAGERITINLGEQNTLAWRGGIPAAGIEELESITKDFSKVTFADATSDAFFKKADVLTAAGSFYTYNKGGNTPFLQSQWARQNARAPWLSASFTLDKNGEYEIGFAFGGLINISPANCYSPVELTFTGAVETPHYVLGVTTPEYFDEYLRQAPGVIAALDTENGQLLGPTGEAGTTSYMRQVKTDEIDKLAMLWHSFFSVNESFTGGVYNRYNKVMFDWHVPAGAAVALGGHTYACPTSWFNGAMNYRGLLKAGTWGVLHEIGHNHGGAYGSIWGFGAGREGEVRNNALTLLAYIISCDVGTTIRNGGDAEHGAYANPYSVLTETLNFKNYDGDYDDGKYGYFQCLGMYANIMHAFGADKYYELLYSYGETANFVEKRDDDAKNIYKRADFAYRCSLIYGMNFVKYFNTFYAANIPEDYFTEEQLSYMKSLPNYEPVANFYAGEIDGVKTAGDYIVNYGADVTMDLFGKTISSLDDGENKGFTIISVGKPDHGTINKADDGQYVYSFDKEYTGATDKFSFDIKLSDGVIHRFTVHLRINYGGARVQSFGNITVTAKDGEAKLQEALAQTSTLTPEILTVSSPTLSYTSPAGQNEVKIVDFYLKAPESGVYELALKGDDYAYAYIGKDFESLENVMTLKGYSESYSENLLHEVSLEKGEFYAVRLYNLNTGGKGGVAMGIRLKGETSFRDMPADYAYHPDLNNPNAVENYVFEPKYLISKKDSVKLANTGTDKSEWKVISAPAGNRIHGGQFVTEIMTDEETGEKTEFVTDKWTWLIDGLTGTLFHTSYTGAGVKPPSEADPDVFIIDTALEQNFNFFSISTRNTANALIKKYRLSVSSDNVNYTEISAGDELQYKNAVATLTFPQVSGRYLKLEVMETSGKNFTIISELDAGISSSTQRILPSSSNLLFKTKGWTNSNTLADVPNGYLISEKANEKVVIRFIGESLAVYAATGENYGTANVYVDGKKHSSINLNSQIQEARKLVINVENLQNKEHTVEIITTSANKVMLNVIGIPYMATLINAPNIYAERALAISLTVFTLLFAALLAFVLVLLFVPKFRALVFGNKFVKKLDERTPKTKKPTKTDGEATEKPVKPAHTAKPTAKKAAEAKADKTEKKPAKTSAEQKKTKKDK